MKLVAVAKDGELCEGATLVLPAVAFANIGELSVDLLVHNLEAELVARLDSDNILACVGNNAYTLQPPGLLATALELYHVPVAVLAGSKAFLLQQRAPVIPGRQQAFAAELAAWAKAAGFAQVLLLAGLDAQYRREQQIEGSQLRFWSSTSALEGAEQQQQQGQAWADSCTAARVQQLEPDVVQNEKELHGLLPPWPLLQELQSNGVPGTLLSTFAAEGDNAADAMQLAGTVLCLLDKQGLAPKQQKVQQMQLPCSWAGLMGRRTVDSTLF